MTFERRRPVGDTSTGWVPPAQDESITEDNVRQATVNVDASTSASHFRRTELTYRYSRRCCARHDQREWLQSAELNAGPTATRLSITAGHAEELFAHDVIILLIPIGPNWTRPGRLVDKLVTEYGGGVLHAAVRPHTPSFVREPSVAAARSASGVARSRRTCAQSDRALPDERARSKSRRRLGILRVHHRRRGVGSPDAGRRRRLPAHPVLREKPVATVLMRHGNPRMRNNYGGHVLRRCSSPGPGSGFPGRDVALAAIRTEWFDRFWVQMIRLAEGKLLAERRGRCSSIRNGPRWVKP